MAITQANAAAARKALQDVQKTLQVLNQTGRLDTAPTEYVALLGTQINALQVTLDALEA